MTIEELKNVNGGGSISGTVLNAIVRGITLALELGRSLGTALRRYVTKTPC